MVALAWEPRGDSSPAGYWCLTVWGGGSIPATGIKGSLVESGRGWAGASAQVVEVPGDIRGARYSCVYRAPILSRPRHVRSESRHPDNSDAGDRHSLQVFN